MRGYQRSGNHAEKPVNSMVEPPAEDVDSKEQWSSGFKICKICCTIFMLRDMTLILVVRLRIEEDNKLAQKDSYTPDSAKANMVEHAGSSSRFNSKGNKKDKKKNDKKGKGKSEYLAPKAGIVKQKQLMVDCELDIDCDVSDVCAMISEVNLVERLTMDRSCIYGNSATADIKGEGDVILKMTSEKELNFVLSKNQMYVGKGYAVDAMFKLNVVRSDRGGEYVSPFAKLCAKHGIRHEFTAPYSPQQNGIAERYPKEYNNGVNLGNASFFENYFLVIKGTGSSSRLDDKVLRGPPPLPEDKRQIDVNDLQDERQDQNR
ncbi:retrotransposon protein, putative, ty1-copia subclass [Tanacetum coccineum]